MKNPFETQQTRARKEFNALGRAEKNRITSEEVITELLTDMGEPESEKSPIQAEGAYYYMLAVKNGEIPITKAVNRCLERKNREAKANLTPKPV